MLSPLHHHHHQQHHHQCHMEAITTKNLVSYFSNKKRLVVTLITFSTLLYLLTHLYIARDLVYLFRPVFDRDVGLDFVELPHFDNPSLNASQLCAIHGWKKRPTSSPPVRIIDAAIFSIELDLLELRLRELWDVVDLFLVLEASRTFSGRPKALHLKANLARFAWASEKLRLESLTSLTPLSLGQSPFANEVMMRDGMTAMVKRFAAPGDLVFISDLDEIPRASTLGLFRQCTGYPLPIHLRMKTYFYSFQFYFPTNEAWRNKLIEYNPNNFTYAHAAKVSKFILADSGWHCTFCFRRLSDFRFKMISYSHNDRLMNRKELLENDEIQRRICSGRDVFDMYPEVYSFRDMLLRFGAISKTTSFVDLPKGLIENQQRFRYLLSGADNCLREDYTGTFRPTPQ